MIKVDETEPIGELEAKFPYRDVNIKRGVDVKKFYDLEAEIGRGKFGTVYLCREKATNLALAAKFVGIQRRQDRKNVEREVEIMRTLQHPRLIQLYDAFESENTMVVVLELIEGGELFERVIGDDFILTEKACTIFMRQICEGVAFIHKNNIIHLDLKPENILCLTKTGNRIKIIDFGLARYYEPGSKLQVLFGTPEFVAPEVVNFDQISPATDMWSVGVICYVLLSGLSPFMGDTDVETMSNVTLGRYDFDDESFDSISDNAKDFISNLLLNKKEARLTGDQTLEHPWLKRKIPPPPPELISTKENLRTFVDNYHNNNGIENNVEHIINTKPSGLSAVELIAASDKEFMNGTNVKSFSNDSNENPLQPARFPIVVTNNHLSPVSSDNSLAVECVPRSDDDVLNMMNANVPSMPTVSVLDNESAALPSESVPVSVASISQLVHVDEIQNNNVPVTNPKVELPTVKTEDLPINMPLADIPPRVLAGPEIPVASLPFISKSLPAAAAMLDDNMVDQLKPLHIPLIPTLPAPDVIDEPIVVHPPVFSTTLPPPKRASIDVDSVFSVQKLEELDKVLGKRGSIDIISLIPKRGSIETGTQMSKRESVDLAEMPLKNQISEKELSPQTLPSLSWKPPSPVLNSPMPEAILSEPTSKETEPDVMPSTSGLLEQIPPIDEVPKGVAAPEPEIPQVPATNSNLASQPITTQEFQAVFPIVPSSPGVPVAPAPESPVLPQPPLEDLFIPQPPAVARILTSPLIARTSPVATALPPVPLLPTIEQDVVPIVSPSFHQSRNFSPSFSSPRPSGIPESPRSPTSPLLSDVVSASRRESPLQKTLDEIPKLSSEILSSLKNMPSLSRTSSYDVSSSKTSFVSKRTSSTESTSSYTSERVTSPRVVSFTEHTTSSFASAITPKVYPKIHGITLGKTPTEEKSAFAPVPGRAQGTNNNRSDNKESETSRQFSQRIESRTSKFESSRTEVSRSDKTSKAEADALAFKQKLRSTAPWFSERKAAENDKNIEKRSTDINTLLKENLGPLERSPWAREIRKISAKLVEMSHTAASNKQEGERLQEMNQQSAKRQKFKVSVLNRDVVFGAAREFYIGGEVSGAASPLKDQLLSKNTSQSHAIKTTSSASTSIRSPRLSPERKNRPSTFKSSSTK